MAGQCDDNGLKVPISNLEAVGFLTVHQFIVLLGLLFAGSACLLSFYQVFKHTTNYTKPHEQRQIIRICLMVPVFSLSAWLSIVYFQHHVILKGIYQLYEAFVLAAFFTLLCQYLQPHEGTLRRSFDSVEIKDWFFLKPFKFCFRPCSKSRNVPREANAGVKWFSIIWFCIFQYSFIKLLSTIALLITEAVGIYCAESNGIQFAHFWINMIQVVSLLFAMNCLIQFYIQCRSDLKPHKPVLKFSAIKIIIFLLFIQTIVLDALVGSENSPIKPSEKVSYPSLAVGLPNLVLCFEMLIVATLHIFAYPWVGYSVIETSRKDRALQAVTSIVMLDIGTRINTFPEAVENYGGFLGWRAFLDALNFIDIFQSVAKGLHWLFVEKRL